MGDFHVLHVFRGDNINTRYLVSEQADVPLAKPDGTANAITFKHLCRLPGKHNDNLVAHAPHIQKGLIAEAGAKGKQQDEGSRTPHDSDNSKGAAQALLVQIAE